MTRPRGPPSMLWRFRRPWEPHLVSEVLDLRIDAVSSFDCVYVGQRIPVGCAGPADRANHQFFTAVVSDFYQGRTAIRAVQRDQGTRGRHGARGPSGRAKVLYERKNGPLDIGEQRLQLRDQVPDRFPIGLAG